MKKLFLLTALVLSACAPGVTSAPTDPGGAALTLTQAEGYKVVSFTAGTQDAQGVKITLTGVGLAVNNSSCKAVGTQLVCEVGAVPAGRSYLLPARGVLLVETNYNRADGTGYTLTAE